MDIIVTEKFKCINPFELHDLPEFVVLTGENGTGKTQLFEYLYASSMIGDDGVFRGDMEGCSNGDVFEFVTSHSGSTIDTETGIECRVFPSRVLVNNNRLTHCVYRPVEVPHVDVGETYNLNQLKEEGDRLAQKHFFMSSHPELGRDCKALTNAFNKMLGYVKGSNFSSRDVRIPEFTTKDIEIIEQIESSFPKDFSKDSYYYISLLPPPQKQVFSANIRYLFYQYWARVKAGLNPTTRPWAEFNEIGKELGFRFEIDEPRLAEESFEVRLRDKKKGVFISPRSLSSGEKVVFSLFVALHSTKILASKPEVIMFDEPDAYLHPSLTSTMIKVLCDVFIRKYGITILLTTHSPSTVALSPEQSIFTMNPDLGIMQKISKKDAIRSLTNGLNTLSVYYENHKQVFVEAKNDALVFNYMFQSAQQHGFIQSKDIQLHFINVDEKKDGGCSKVKDTVSILRNNGNQTVWGLIDWDGKNTPKEYVKVLGHNTRYAIDNYLVDPVSMSILFLDEEKEKTKIGFLPEDNITGFAKKTNDDIQSIINSIVSQLSTIIPSGSLSKASIKDYSLADGRVFKIPQWFMEIKGHDLVDYYRKAFPFLNKFQKEYDLYKRIVSYVYDNYPGIIPQDIIDSFGALQSEL